MLLKLHHIVLTKVKNNLFVLRKSPPSMFVHMLYWCELSCGQSTQILLPTHCMSPTMNGADSEASESITWFEVFTLCTAWQDESEPCLFIAHLFGKYHHRHERFSLLPIVPVGLRWICVVSARHQLQQLLDGKCFQHWCLLQGFVRTLLINHNLYALSGWGWR